MDRHPAAGIALRIKLFALVFSFLAMAAISHAQVPDGLFPEGVRVGFVLRFNALPKQAVTKPPLLRIDHEGRPTVLFGNALFVLDGVKALPIPLADDEPLNDFAWMNDGALIGIRRDRLGFPGPGGMAELIRLPERNMRIVSGDEDKLYLYGGETRDQRRRAYIMIKDLGLKHLVEMPYPITSLAANGLEAFVAIGRSVMFVSPEKPISLVYRPRFEVNHLAYAPPHGLFYATHQEVGFVISPGRGFTFLRAPGVQPLVHGEDLYLLIPKTGILKVSPISAFKTMAEKLN